MFIRSLGDYKEFIAGDDSLLCELLHPDKHDVHIRYSLAHATVKPGQATKRHKLKTAEVYYILKGKGEMCIDTETAPVTAGMAVYIPPNSIQDITNTGDGDLSFICVVDPAWRPENEEVL